MNQPRRRMGRPPLCEGEQSTRVNVRMGASMYDRTYARARAARVSVPALIRRALERLLSEQAEPPADAPPPNSAT